MSAPKSAAIRRYQLHFKGQSAHVVCTGPQDVLNVGVGRDLGDAIALAGLLFPICPRAHQIAALRAAEQAGGIQLPVAQALAREIALLSEGVFSAVWRAALSWAKMLGQPVPAAAVQMARSGNDDIVRGLFDGPWAALGGGRVIADRPALLRAAGALAKAFYQVRPLGLAARAYAADVCLDVPAVSAVHAASFIGIGLDAAGAQIEESPRALLSGQHKPPTLAPWFDAQLAHAEGLLIELHEAIHQLRPAQARESAVPLTGSGIGIAMTARGRLRHALSLEGGVVTSWSAMAPTDWNFAANGPAARAAGALQSPDAKAAACLIAAFDPCAPCDAVMEEAQHA